MDEDSRTTNCFGLNLNEEEGMKFLLTGTMAYRQMVANAVAHLLRYVPSTDIVVVVPDEETRREYDLKCGVVVRPCYLPKGEQLYTQGSWGEVVRWKLETIVDRLKISDVFYIDPDVVVFDDIRRYLPDGAWDICAQQNVDKTVCMGIVAARPTNFAIRFLTPNGPLRSDDEYIEKRWRWNHTKDRLRMFPSDQFPVGAYPLKLNEAVCYHYNHTVGVEAKIKRMQEDGNWIV
jgi:hypothetical protein